MRRASSSDACGASCRQIFPRSVRALTDKARDKAASIATRKASQEAIEGLAPMLPELIGGSADLAGSNLTLWSGSRAVGGNERRQLSVTTACASSAWPRS